MNIEKYLILNQYLLSLFGVSNFKDLQEKLHDAPVGVDGDGRSHFINILRSSFDNLKISEDILLRYDENIQDYVKKINQKRNGSVSLKYFQYLSVLFTEIFFDSLKNRKEEFISEVNEFLQDYKKKQDIEMITEFTEKDLKKIAFWMATGSGKTLIMHINYYQFFRYQLFSPDNIILITPNEGLSKQHFEELQKSSIPCQLYTGSLNGGFKQNEEILVIEMTKFVDEKKGGGKTLPVSAFEGANLVFVDEGHKGRRSEEQKWAKLRNKLAEKGFVFEYSATFGQILSESNKELLKEYAKSIIFDYSYRYFYLDGYGKNFSVLNVNEPEKINERNFQETALVANLLSFYEQILVYEENIHLAKEYNIEKPLWIFVGTTVTGKNEESDVIQIVEFIKRVIQDDAWVNEKVEKILKGSTGLKDENNEDVFKNKLEYLKKRKIDFADIYKKIFGGKGAFSIYELKNAEGEFGLKIGENNYFGVINIGNTSGFKKQLEKLGISVKQDVVSGSLFDDIKREDSPVNLLIGSKKFIEGWDTWRVSSMGLLNIGKGQGPQIIQLFGRGVRLKGKGMSLKRSEHPIVKSLEMLNIYGIKADYLSKFLEAISKEEVEFETIEIPVKPQHENQWKSLYTLTNDEEKRFEEEEILRLEIDDRIYFTIDLLPKVFTYLAKERKEDGITIEQIKAEVKPIRLTEDIINLLDWDRIWDEMCNFRILKGYWNLVIDKERLKNLLLSNRYKIVALPEILEIKTLDDVVRVEDIAILVIKKYIDLFYKKYAKLFETKHLKYTPVGKQQTLFVFEKPEKKYNYTLQIDKKEKNLVKEIKKLAKDSKQLINEDNKTLPRIYFDRHLYIPILLQSKKIVKMSPAGLVESEKEFVSGLRDYLKKNKNKFLDVEIYLLRNYPKTGVGFQLPWSGFYPDFIMWVKDNKKQKIVFVDPKGLEHEKELDQEKIKLKDDIKQLEQNLGNKRVVLESFILSKTPYEKLIEGRTSPPSKDEYIKNHVLFLEDKNWPEKLLNSIIMTSN